MKKAHILNCDFAPLTLEQTLDAVVTMIRRAERGYLCTVNVAILMMMRSNDRLRRFIEGSFLTVADGTPLVWASRILGTPLPERVTGVDLIEHLCDRAAGEGLGVYLLGSKLENVQEVARRLRQSRPNLKIVGVDDGYFDEQQAVERVQAINASGARILIVAMGVPRQEKFIEDHWQNLRVNFAIGVGGSFDVLAGKRIRAPKFLQHVGLEWAFRLIQEPRRLFFRYLVTNSQFIYLFVRRIVNGR
jgi:N-acetylglucosaminyldiphosphoundecaprenol N-acetyl-beta-D-mannosaminyltransferase